MILHLAEALIVGTMAGFLGRLGGTCAGTLWRDLGVPSCMVLLMILLGDWHWSLILCFGLTFGACTTYFKKKGADVRWFNWLFVGLAFSIAMLPYAWATGHWWGLLFRGVSCTAGVVLWDILIGWDFLEEFGRYFIVIFTLILL